MTQSLVRRVDLELGTGDVRPWICQELLDSGGEHLHRLGLLPEHDQGLPLLIQEVTIQRKQL